MGHFMTGILMDRTDWTPAKWLAAPNNITMAPIFTKNFEIESGDVVSAVLCITARTCFFRPSVFNACMEPPITLLLGWTEYRSYSF